MTRIAIDNQLTTVISLYSVSPDRQSKLVDKLVYYLQTTQQQHGFVSASIHKSLDGEKVANYMQWETQEDYEAFINNAGIQGQFEKQDLQMFGEIDTHIYEIFASQSKVDPPEIKEGEYIVHFAEFRMESENQPRMVELAKEHITPAMELEGLISANFHRSLDGTRAINYGQWRDPKTIEELRKKPGFGSEKPYWEGIAENEYHLYEVIFVTEISNKM
ncbi:MAG: antibiotic biosynthesis monooxygenase [Microcoleaceae cyanobacterium]